MGERAVYVALALLFLSVMLPLHPTKGDVFQDTILSVEPQGNFGLTIGQQFSINITVTNVADLYAWQFYLYYQRSVLNGSVLPSGDPRIYEGDFLPTGGLTYFAITIFDDNYNATHGLIYLSSTLVGSAIGVTGSGNLCTIWFEVRGQGNSVLDLENTKLIDSASPFGNLIPHTVIDGSAYSGLVNIAVTDINTPIDIPEGSIAYINVTTQNKGQMAETFDVTLSDDPTLVETKTVMNLQPGETSILTFTWDTTPVPIGEYNLTAIADTVPGEQDLSDNTFTLQVYVGTRDLTVTDLRPHRTVIPIGFPTVDIIVSVENNGQATETFNVTLLYGSTIIENQTTALVSGGNGNFTFTWITSILQYGNYSLLADAIPLPYETHTSDNNLTRYAVVTIPGDINGDRTVDIYDAITLAAGYDLKTSDPKWNVNADINGDNAVDIFDAIILGSHFNQSI